MRFTAADWSCISIANQTLAEGVTWLQQNCTRDAQRSPPTLVVNSITVDITRSDIRLVAAQAADSGGNQSLKSLPDIGRQDPRNLAGINGGYFWRVDVNGFWRDNVCRGKRREEAEKPADPSHPNYGVGDGVVIVDGVLKSSNCNCTGNSRPAVMLLNGDESAIEVLQRGESPAPGVPNALGAGPNLVSWNASAGAAFVDIPKDDDNVNRVVREAATAAGLVQHMDDATGKLVASAAVLVTTDGSDSCHVWEEWCGLQLKHLATLMRDVHGCTSAMSMDQGGSTTMWLQKDVSGQADQTDGVVSNADNVDSNTPGAGRAIANGLFVQSLASTPQEA